MTSEQIQLKIIEHEQTIAKLRAMSKLHPNLFEHTIARHQRDINALFKQAKDDKDRANRR